MFFWRDRRQYVGVVKCLKQLGPVPEPTRNLSFNKINLLRSFCYCMHEVTSILLLQDAHPSKQGHGTCIGCAELTVFQVVNDDGPPSMKSSPYVHSMVDMLQKNGHVVSVILPHVQRSWIGKAHFVDKVLTPTYFRPGPSPYVEGGTAHERPLNQDETGEEWVLVDGTPAACVHLGLWHFFQDRGPVDLVLSGPNYGRNSSTLYQLASGTIGGAMEAANFRKKAVALSFAYFTKEYAAEPIVAASKHALKIIEHLCQNWASDVEVYSIKYGPLAQHLRSLL